jgi:hypothetical protein
VGRVDQMAVLKLDALTALILQYGRLLSRLHKQLSRTHSITSSDSWIRGAPQSEFLSVWTPSGRADLDRFAYIALSEHLPTVN